MILSKRYSSEEFEQEGTIVKGWLQMGPPIILLERVRALRLKIVLLHTSRVKNLSSYGVLFSRYISQ